MSNHRCQCNLAMPVPGWQTTGANVTLLSQYQDGLGLVCWWWRFDWSFARLIAPLITTTSIILSSDKIRNRDILVLTNVGPPGKVAVKMERERQRERVFKRPDAFLSSNRQCNNNEVNRHNHQRYHQCINPAMCPHSSLYPVTCPSMTCSMRLLYGHTHRQTDRQTERQTDRRQFFT